MYTIEQLSMITGLSTRTLRNYLKSGLLQGSKETGIWKFTEQQVSDFITHPAVYPSIQTKQNAVVYDFLSDLNQSENEECILLNRTIAECKAKEIADFFCNAVSGLSHIRFTYTYRSGKARYILRGSESDVRQVMEKFYQQV